MGVNSLPKTVTRQRRGCDLKPGPSAPESRTLTTRLPSHPIQSLTGIIKKETAAEHVARWACWRMRSSRASYIITLCIGPAIADLHRTDYAICGPFRQPA